jgi:LuxR family maltose regulon positive regulatory protein
MDDAQQAYTEAVQIGQLAGNAHMTMMSNIQLADVYFEQGRFHQAARVYFDILLMAEQVDGNKSSYAQRAHFGLSRVYYSWNRLDEAAASSEQCLRLCQHWGNVSLQAACLALIAHIHRARGDLTKAQEAADAAQTLIQEHTFSPYWSVWIWLSLARFSQEQGKIEEALFGIYETGILPEAFAPEVPSCASLSLDEHITYRMEPAYLILARLFLTTNRLDAVLTICERLLPEAKAGERSRTITELQILQALAYHAKKDTSSALHALEGAISLSWPEQARRVFVDEGVQMAKLLYLAKVHHLGGEFVERLLFDFEQPSSILRSPARPVQNRLVEPLSARELEVLRAIAEGCSNQEIADRFVLSPMTIKRHISNINAKLEAKNRTQAVALARSLKLIE